MRQLYAGIALLATTSVAGCSFSHGKIGEQKDASTIDAPQIDAPQIDAPPIDAPPDTPPAPTDTDGDTVADSADNCPTVANTNQRNHDADPKGDACDRCPHLPSTTDPDGDGDGVGDACDPRVGTAGDSIALFEGFYDATAIAGWIEAGNGTWTVGNGVLTQSVTTVAGTNRTIGPNLNLPRSAVTSMAKVLTLGNGTGFDAPYVSVVSGVTNSTSAWCSVVRDGSDRKVYATTVRPFNTQFPSDDWPGTFANNSEVQMTSALVGTSNVCTVVQGTTSLTVNGPIDAAAGTPQLATRSASASFDYLFVVSIGN